MEHERFALPATDAEGATTAQPERDLQPGDPNLVGAAPVEEKKGIAERVKSMMGRHGRKKHRGHTKDAAAATEGSVLSKFKAKASSKVGHGPDGSKRGPARLLSMSSSSSSMSSSDEEDIGTVGFAVDPTGPAVAGSNLGRQDFSSAPQGPGADFSELNLNSDANGEVMDEHSKRAAEFAERSNPLNPNYGEPHPSHPTETSNSNLTQGEDAHGEPHHSQPTETANSNQATSDYSEPHPTNPTETANFQRGATLGEHDGNLDDAPRDDNVSRNFL